MKFTIEITKEVIDESLMCGTKNSVANLSESCAFVVAYNELVPNVQVGIHTIAFYGKSGEESIEYISTTDEQIRFILLFDSLSEAPKKRYELVGRKFEVEIPDKVIEYWHGDAVFVAQKLVNSNILKIA